MQNDLTTDLFGFSRPQKRKDSETWSKLLLYAKMWQEKYGEQYIIVWGFDGKMMVELKGVSPDMMTERLGIYFADDWYSNCKHSLAAFVKNFNKFINENPGISRPPAIRKSVAVGNLVADLMHTCRDHPEQRLVEGICQKCFPACAHCGENHYIGIPCEEHAKMMPSFLRKGKS